MTKLVAGDEVYAIRGAAFAVHNERGEGFLEAVYQEAMEGNQGPVLSPSCPFMPQHPVAIKYKGQTLESRYYADLLCCDSIMVELKALRSMGGTQEASY